jgi:hypothetical protein
VGFTFLGGFGLGPSVEELHRQRDLAAVWPYWPAIVVVGLTGLAIVVYGVPAALARGASGRYVLLWAVIPMLFVFGGSWVRNGAFNVRYVLIALPAVLSIAALGVTNGGRTRLWLGTAALVLLSLVSIARERSDTRYAREDLRSAAQYLGEHAAAGDRIVVSGYYMRYGLDYYYRGKTPRQGLKVRNVRTPEDVTVNLHDVTAPARPTWLVLTREWEDDPAGLFAAGFAAAVSAEPRVRFSGIRIYYFPPVGAADQRS